MKGGWMEFDTTWGISPQEVSNGRHSYSKEATNVNIHHSDILRKGLHNYIETLFYKVSM